jgi:putative transposase
LIQARIKATEAIRSAFTRRKQGRRVFQPRSQLCPARYNLHTYKVDWAKQEARLSSAGGKVSIPFSLPPYALKYAGLPTATADLIYRKGSFRLHVVVTMPDTEVVGSGQVIGVDLGLNPQPSRRYIHPGLPGQETMEGC